MDSNTKNLAAEAAEALGLSDREVKDLMDLQAMATEPLHEDLVPWVEDGEWGEMLRHPLVYQVPLITPGHANETYQRKKELIADAEADGEWDSVVFMHERPYRLKALIDYCTGRDEEGNIIPLVSAPEHWDLAADVWVDSENINQNIEEWRALICSPGEYPTGLWLGTKAEREAFNNLDWDEDGTILALRGGAVGDWSWTMSSKTAEFFARLSGIQPRSARIHRDECFGYLTRRGEFELLVKLTDERVPLVYPGGMP